MLRCKICSATMKNHMVRHIKTKHPVLYLKSIPLKIERFQPESRLKRSWVRKYCVSVGENENKCSICQNVLKMPKGLFGNMKRHIIKKHPNVYEMEMKIEDDSEDLDLNLTRDELYSEEEVLDEQMLELENFEESNANSKDAVEEESCQSPMLEETVYQDVDDLDTESDTPDFGDIDYISEKDPYYESKIKCLSQRAVIGKAGKIKTCIWNFFTMAETNRSYTCVFCRKNVHIFPQSSSNLKRHLAKKHKSEFSIIVKYAPEFREEKNMKNLRKVIRTVTRADDYTKSFEMSYFVKEDDDRFKCRSCEEIIERADPESLTLFKHIHEKHADEVIGHIQENANDDEEISVLFVRKKDMPIL